MYYMYNAGWSVWFLEFCNGSLPLSLPFDNGSSLCFYDCYILTFFLLPLLLSLCLFCLSAASFAINDNISNMLPEVCAEGPCTRWGFVYYCIVSCFISLRSLCHSHSRVYILHLSCYLHFIFVHNLSCFTFYFCP